MLATEQSHTGRPDSSSRRSRLERVPPTVVLMSPCRWILIGTQPTAPARPLCGRDLEILRHVDRYRLSVNEVLHDLYFPGTQPNAVTKATARLCREGYLRPFPLVPSRRYFVPGPRAISVLGCSTRRSEPLGPQSLPTEPGVLEYCTLSNSRHLSVCCVSSERPFAHSVRSRSPVVTCMNAPTTVVGRAVEWSGPLVEFITITFRLLRTGREQ
jgi:hypothetical protein